MLPLALACLLLPGVPGSRIFNAESVAAQCRMETWEREDCGFVGVDQGGCEAKGCCWEPSHSGAPWCFQAQAPDTGGAQCAAADHAKRDCGFAGVTKQGCEDTGCCWAKSSTGAPWCFAKLGDHPTEDPATPTALPPAGGKLKLKSQPVVYQISTRPWLFALAKSGMPAECGNGRGTAYVCLRDVPDEEWLRIKNDHADMVWLMGMWELGNASLKLGTTPQMMNDFRHDLPDAQPEDVIGSPYAIVDYTVNPDIGTDADLAAVREKLHALGMSLMVDFVPNHQARDSRLWREHPEAFMLRPPGDTTPDSWWLNQDGKSVAFGRGPYDGPWTDTLQINYFSPEAAELLKAQLVSVARRADGIRLDMAHLILNEVFARAWDGVYQKGGFHRPQREFWETAIREVKRQYPGTIFLSEAYDYYFTQPPEQELLGNLGIDYSYNKVVLDKLEAGDLGQLKDYIRSKPQAYFARMGHFVENHDEPRAALALGGPQQGFVGSVVAGTLPGLRLFYFGQYDGFRNRLGVHLRRGTPEQPDPALHAQYSRLMGVLADPVFHEGRWSFVDTPWGGSAWRLAAWRWERGGAKRLVVINFSDQQAWGDVPVANAAGPGGSDGVRMTELLGGQEYTRSAGELRSKGLTVGVAPWSAQIFAY